MLETRQSCGTNIKHLSPIVPIAKRIGTTGEPDDESAGMTASEWAHIEVLNADALTNWCEE